MPLVCDIEEIQQLEQLKSCQYHNFDKILKFGGYCTHPRSPIRVKFGTLEGTHDVLPHATGTSVLRFYDKQLSYRRRTTRCIVSIEILPIATQQCRNYLYDKS